MRQLTPGLQAARNELRDLDPWVVLFEFEIPTSPPTRYRMVANEASVQFGTDSDGAPISYDPFPIRLATIRSSGSGDLTQLEIEVANVDRLVGLSIEEHDGLIGQPVRVLIVNMADLANPASCIEERGEIQGVSVNAQTVAFYVASENIAERRFPPQRMSALSCRHAFGDANCAYQIPAGATNEIGFGFTHCRKSLNFCEIIGADEAARGVEVLHPRRLGGAPGLPRSSRGF